MPIERYEITSAEMLKKGIPCRFSAKCLVNFCQKSKNAKIFGLSLFLHLTAQARERTKALRDQPVKVRVFRPPVILNTEMGLGTRLANTCGVTPEMLHDSGQKKETFPVPIIAPQHFVVSL